MIKKEMEKMKDLLIHVTDKRYDTLLPIDGNIYFSKNKFISHFGEYIYLFNFHEMSHYFKIEERESGSLRLFVATEEFTLNYKSQRMGKEYIIKVPIDVNRYCLQIIEQWNHMKGILEERMFDEVIKRKEINFGRTNEHFHRRAVAI